MPLLGGLAPPPSSRRFTLRQFLAAWLPALATLPPSLSAPHLASQLCTSPGLVMPSSDALPFAGCRATSVPLFAANSLVELNLFCAGLLATLRGRLAARSQRLTKRLIALAGLSLRWSSAIS